MEAEIGKACEEMNRHVDSGSGEAINTYLEQLAKVPNRNQMRIKQAWVLARQLGERQLDFEALQA